MAVKNGYRLVPDVDRNETDLFLAVKNKDLIMTKKLFEAGADLNFPNSEKWTPIHYAIEKEYFDIIVYLLDQGANLDFKNIHGVFPLMTILKQGRKEMFKSFVLKGASINNVDDTNSTVLHYVTKMEDIELVKFLEKADHNIQDNAGNTPLHYACLNGAIEIATILLQRGAKGDLLNNNQNTPFDIAMEKESYALYEPFKESMNIKYKLSTIRRIYKKGYNLQSYSPEINSRQPKEKVVAPIFEYVDINELDKNGETALFRAVRNNNFNTTKKLVEAGADLDIPNSEHWTPIHYAIQRSRLFIIIYLMDKGANLDIINIFGTFPLMTLSSKDLRGIFKSFVSKGASIDNVDNNNATILHYVTKINDIELVKFLKKADHNVQDNDGNTPLHYACLNGAIKIATILLERGAKGDILNNDGNTPFHIAMQKGFYNLYDAFKESGMDIDKTLRQIKKIYKQKEADLAPELVMEATKDNQVGSSSAASEIESNAAFLKKKKRKNKNANSKPTVSGDKLRLVDAFGKKKQKVKKASQKRVKTAATVTFDGYEAEINKLLKKLPPNCENRSEYLLFEALNADSDEEHINIERIKFIIFYYDPDINFQYVNRNNDTVLLMATQMNDLSLTTLFLSNGSDPNLINDYEWTPLTTSIVHWNTKIAKKLLKNGSDPNLTFKNGLFPLKLAVRIGNIEMVKLLLKYGANINKTDDYGSTVLHTAIYKRNIEMVSELLGKKINVNIRNKGGFTALHDANKENFVEAVDKLKKYMSIYNRVEIENDERVTTNEIDEVLTKTYQDFKNKTLNDETYTELHALSFEGSIDEKLLTEENIESKTIFGYTPLHLAVKSNKKAPVKVLIQNGASMYIANDFHNPPFYDAIQDGRLGTVQLFLSYFDLRYKNKKGETALKIASRQSSFKITQLIIDKIIDLNNDKFPYVQLEKPGYTNLNLAAIKGDLEIINLLLLYGIDLNCPFNGVTPLYNAIKHNQTSVVEFLIKNGADINLPSNSKYLPLHTAVKYGYMDIIQYLCKSGADINQINLYNNTPLQVAVRFSTESIMELLLDLGADINKFNSQGQTALYFAGRNNNVIIDYLVEKGANVCCRGKDFRNCLESHLS